ncbi:hypothetical protein FA15DRAFT_675579 [Coprinopsis marcescibilis]|uniref:CBM1 domain-containing protein n=1 Tax=Coprinopsis marcescibilis TaxID=230819 RepID=A0A5C3KDH2_COPMA|nr:hypothetical protein FA15DRAFT_675579 [Coprinopsis marcescibilis]
MMKFCFASSVLVLAAPLICIVSANPLRDVGNTVAVTQTLPVTRPGWPGPPPTMTKITKTKTSTSTETATTSICSIACPIACPSGWTFICPCTCAPPSVTPI